MMAIAEAWRIQNSDQRVKQESPRKNRDVCNHLTDGILHLLAIKLVFDRKTKIITNPKKIARLSE